MISIHALREEGDIADKTIKTMMAIFLSTPSARRATIRGIRTFRVIPISIHALREEGDRNCADLYTLKHISIHALREEGDGR